MAKDTGNDHKEASKKPVNGIVYLAWRRCVMSIIIAICDDMAEDIELLSDALTTYDPSFKIITFTNGETLIDELLDSSISVDILFLDIYMPQIDGVKTAQRLRDGREDLKIIFVSSSKEHYPQAYEVFAFNYILKPLDIERLYSVLDRALDELRRERSQKISFSYKSVMYHVDCRDISYIESRDKLILLHLRDGNTQQSYGKLDEIAKDLPKQSFIRCHKSFIVNASCITEMGENYFRIGPVLINISRRYLKFAKDQYYEYIFSYMGRGTLG
jgi:DNA-binding LytR/AlgR family response regulator